MDRSYRTYSFVLAAALALAAMLAVSGCGDDYLVSESSLPKLEQHIFVLPDRYSSQPYLYSSPTNTVYLDTNESVKFWAVYALDSTYMPSDSADSHYLSHSWTIDGEEYNISPLRFSFKTPGYRQGILQTIDLFQDTLRDTIDIFVNTPGNISLVAPVNGFNQVRPNSDSEVEIRWTLSGLDPWETATCNVFASFDKDSVWDHNLGSVNCLEKARFVGTFLADSLLDYLDEHPEADTSVTLYWAMRVAFHAKGGFIEIDSTEIFHFSTLFLHEDSSVITIPIKYEDFRKNKAWAHVVITDKLGDTLFSNTVRNVPTTVSAKVAPQTGLRISVEELTMTEYQAEATTVSTTLGTQTIIDTVRLRDKVQPQVAPRSGMGINNEEYNPIMGDTVYFYALDNGSGINQSRISVTADADTIEHVYEDPFIKFQRPCMRSCKIRVNVVDYAHNESPQVYWLFTPDSKDSLFTGPFSELGDDL